MHGFEGMGWGMGLWWILGPIVLGLLIWLIAGIFRQTSLPESGSAIDILKQRYARGEISKEEFEEKKRDLI